MARTPARSAAKPSRPAVAAGAARPRTGLILAAILAGLVLAVFVDVFLSGKPRAVGHEGSDLDGQFLAWRSFAFGELSHGRLPLWNPHVFGGAPFLGGGQAALLYPPNTLYLLLPLDLAINADVALHVLLAGGLMTWWMRRRGLSAAASLLAGVMVMFGGPYFAHVYAGHLSNLATAAWAPLLFLAIDGLLAERRLRWPLLGAGAAAMQVLAGHWQYLFYCGVAAGLYFLLHVGQARGRLRACGALAGMFAGGALLAAVQILTGLDAASESARSGGLAYHHAASFAFPPESLLTLLAPRALGGPEGYFGRGNWWETSAFLGAAGCFLALYGLVHARGRRLRLGVMAGAMLLLALGSYTPLYRVLYHVPPFGQFRGISKFIFLAGLFAAALAAYGLDALRQRRAEGKVTLRPAVGALAAAALLAGAGLLIASGGASRAWHGIVNSMKQVNRLVLPTTYSEAFIEAAAVEAGHALLLAAAALAVLAAALAALRRTPRAAWAVLVLAAVELLAFARFHRPTCDVPAASDLPLKAVLGGRIQDGRLLMAGSGNVPMYCGMSDLWGSDPMVMNRYAHFVSHALGQPAEDANITTRFIESSTPVAPAPAAAAGAYVDANGVKVNRLFGMLRLRFSINPLLDAAHALAEYRDALPRALLVSDWRVLPQAADVLAAMDSPEFDPRRTVLLETEPFGGAAPAAGKDVPGASATSAPAGADEAPERPLPRVALDSTDRFRIEVDAAAPCILLVTDAYSRSWRVRAQDPATAPQASYQLLPANYCLQGIPLAAGRHRLVLEYLPRAFVIGKWISIAALVLYAGLWAWERRSSRRERRAAAVAAS